MTMRWKCQKASEPENLKTVGNKNLLVCLGKEPMELLQNQIKAIGESPNADADKRFLETLFRLEKKTFLK